MTRSAMSATAALWVITTVVVPELLVDAGDGFEHHDAGRQIQRAGGLVAQQDVGLLGDGAGDGHTLLLAA